MNMKKLMGLVTGLALVGIAGMSSDANAGGCQAQTGGWPFSLTCNWRAQGWGVTESGTKVVYAKLIGNGNGLVYALTNGVKSDGNLIPLCQAIDDEIDAIPEDDRSGCSSAVGGFLAGPNPYP